MAGFYDRTTVLESLELHRETGKVTTGTLTLNDGNSTTCSYSYVAVHPPTESTALGTGGAPVIEVEITAFQFNETYYPRADDKWTVGGTDYLISRVRTERNVDSGYAVHSCACVRPA